MDLSIKGGKINMAKKQMNAQELLDDSDFVEVDTPVAQDNSSGFGGFQDTFSGFPDMSMDFGMDFGTALNH